MGGMGSTTVKNASPQPEVKANLRPGPCPPEANLYARRPVPPATDINAPKQASAPERSHIQRMEALQRANHIRTQRAQVKRDLKARKTTIDRLLENPPEYLETAKVIELLLAVPKYGRVKANKILQQCRISPSKTVGGLSDRQRKELVELLRARLS
jgi:hypothetical protein